MTISTLALLAFCLMTEIARELCFKRAVDTDEKKESHSGLLRMVATTPLLWLGIAFWVAEMTAWILVLERLPLNIAFPEMSLVYSGVPIASHFLLKESVTARHWLGAGVITLGVALVGLTGV